MTPEQMLREFHSAKAIHGGLMPGRPTADIPAWVRTLRSGLLLEEVRELLDAVAEGDITGIADGIADVGYVAVGTAVVYGIPFDEVFAEVHRSNMTKVNSPAEAKLVKGPGYEPPRIAELLAPSGDLGYLSLPARVQADTEEEARRSREIADTLPGSSLNPTPDCGGPRKPPVPPRSGGARPTGNSTERLR